MLMASGVSDSGYEYHHQGKGKAKGMTSGMRLGQEDRTGHDEGQLGPVL